MNQFTAVSTEGMASVEVCIYGNISKTMLMLQGIDPEKGIREGYSYYQYCSDEQWAAGNKEAVSGLICTTPGNLMLVYCDEAEMYEKLDFFKLMREIAPKAIKAEMLSAGHLKRKLDKIKLYYKEQAFIMMKRPFEGLSSFKEMHKALPEDTVLVGSSTSLTDCAEFVIEAERHFGRNPSLVTDMRQIVNERIEAGAYALLKKEDLPACQGAIEFTGNHLAVLGNIYTAARFRKQGLATAVTAELIGRCLENGQVPYLFVLSDNLQAIRLYEHLGFKKVREYCMIEPQV